jgi:TolB-like protein
LWNCRQSRASRKARISAVSSSIVVRMEDIVVAGARDRQTTPVAGLARRVAPAAADAETIGAATMDGTISGTLSYMSPEQLEGRPVDARSDIFSLGAMLYELVTGRRAFHRDSAAGVIAAILHEPPASTTSIPAPVAAVLVRCLNKNRAERFQSAGELKRALEQARVGTPTTPARPAVAVLPFANLTTAAGDYFAEGLTEEIINALTRIPGLLVTARTSSFAAQGRGGDLAKIGARLGVAHVVEGSVRRAGTRIRVTAQLVKVSNGFHVWSDHYDRELTDVFAIQDEIAGAIAETLRVRLVREGGVAKRPTTDPDAYNLYLEGRHLAGSAPGVRPCARAEPDLTCRTAAQRHQRAHAARARQGSRGRTAVASRSRPTRSRR